VALVRWTLQLATHRDVRWPIGLPLVAIVARPRSRSRWQVHLTVREDAVYFGLVHSLETKQPPPSAVR
jgi:hypothetical protein